MQFKLYLKIFVLYSLLGITYAVGAFAQGDVFPSKSIKVIVPFPPGGGTDTLMRIITPPLSEMWKQSIVIENRPGASGAVGADQGRMHGDPSERLWDALWLFLER